MKHPKFTNDELANPLTFNKAMTMSKEATTVTMRPANNEEKNTANKMLAMGINPVEVTLNGKTVRAYMVDKNGLWLGQKTQDQQINNNDE